MKMLVTIVLGLVLTGCGWFDRYVIANTKGHSVECVDGVVYLQFPSGATVGYNRDGTIKVCS